jgi:uncharacterized C2H2 Zn-finger protein
MAQDIIIRTLCDLCLAHDEHTDGKAYGLTDGPVSLDIDLCEIHAKPLAELVEHARPAAKSGSASGPGTACPTCGKVLRTPRGLRKHLTQQHGAPEETVAATLAGTDGETCPDCGRSFAKPQGLSMHRFRAHGIRATEASPTGSA